MSAVESSISLQSGVSSALQNDGGGDIRPELKAELDRYEKYVDAYCEFAKTANDNDTKDIEQEIEFLENIRSMGV